jgi:hypothetical protein
MYKISLILSALVLVITTGCQDSLVDTETTEVASSQTLSKSENARQFGMIWADGELFRTVGTPTSLPESGKFDILYQGSFKDGVGAISESKPGDQDYNGGRWDIWHVKAGVPMDKYVDATSVEDLDPNDFESTGNRLECPLIHQPQGGGR